MNDALTDILEMIKLSSQLYFRTELSSPWGIGIPQSRMVARFHIVTRGSCWLEVKGEPAGLRLSDGDLVIVPHGAEHAISDMPGRKIIPLEQVIDRGYSSETGTLVYGGNGTGCCLVCGEIAFEYFENHPLLMSLPAILFVSSRDGQSTRWLGSTVGLMVDEASRTNPGANAIINRLSEIILVQVIRAFLHSNSDQIPFLAAFADPRISRTLSAIHHDPAYRWSVENLGKLVSMSRSVFANRFQALVGMTPLQYVAFVRMQSARQLLEDKRSTVSVVAESVGYQSEAAFSEAFKKQFSLRPGEYRRAQSKVCRT